MEIKFEEQTYKISQHMWDAMLMDANKKGMTIDEYIVQAFTLLRKQKLKK